MIQDNEFLAAVLIYPKFMDGMCVEYAAFSYDFHDTQESQLIGLISTLNIQRTYTTDRQSFGGQPKYVDRLIFSSLSLCTS